jgi:hypothetical protein
MLIDLQKKEESTVRFVLRWFGPNRLAGKLQSKQSLSQKIGLLIADGDKLFKNFGFQIVS